MQPGNQRQAPPQKRSRSPLPHLAVAAVVLGGLLALSFLSSPGEDDVAADYQNEDYVVPSTNSKVSEIPIPEYEEEVVQWLEANTLYSQQLASPVRCEVTEIPARNTLGDGELQVRMSAYVGCLTRVWGPALEAAGFEAYQPSLFVYPAGDTVTTSCGTQESLNAFYCGADQNLYLASDILRILPQNEADAPEAFDLIIAHEYGHAMQGRSGVFTASYFAGEDAGSESGALEISRRVELQADCYAGAAIDSVSQSMGLTEASREMVARISYEIGDDRISERFEVAFEEGDHGLGESRELWATKGLNGGPLTGCNTFTAPGAEVR